VQPKPILVVEDDQNDVFLLQRTFRRNNLVGELHTVTTVDEAISYLTGEGKFSDRNQFPSPVLMLLDLKLPGKSGFDLLAWLRNQQGLCRLPVVVLTSSAQAEDINKAFDLGANSYLVKDPDPAGFLDLTKLLDLYWLTLNQKPELGLGRRAV